MMEQLKKEALTFSTAQPSTLEPTSSSSGDHFMTHRIAASFVRCRRRRRRQVLRQNRLSAYPGPAFIVPRIYYDLLRESECSRPESHFQGASCFASPTVSGEVPPQEEQHRGPRLPAAVPDLPCGAAGASIATRWGGEYSMYRPGLHVTGGICDPRKEVTGY